MAETRAGDGAGRAVAPPLTRQARERPARRER